MMQEMPEGAEAPAQAPQQGSGPGQLISVLQTGMKKLGALFEKTGLPSEKLAQAIGLFEEAIDEAMGGGDDAAPARPAPSGAGSVEAGGNPNARPM